MFVVRYVTEKPIKVLNKLQDVKCRAGKVAEFTCEIDDLETDADARWYKDDQLIKVGNDLFFLSEMLTTNTKSYLLRRLSQLFISTATPHQITGQVLSSISIVSSSRTIRSCTP